ncbi:RNA-directed DNA polymerase, eukaryota [Tanacetum coccineum]
MSGTVPPILPPLGTSSGNPSSPNVNRVDTMPTTTDPINTTTTTNVSQSVVNENLPQLLDLRGGSHVTNVPAFDKEDFTNGPFVPMSSLSTSENPLPKRQNQWSNAEIRLANQDKRLKSIIISFLPNDVMKSVIKYKTAKEMWNDLILAYEGPSDKRDTKGSAKQLRRSLSKNGSGWVYKEALSLILKINDEIEAEKLEKAIKMSILDIVEKIKVNKSEGVDQFGSDYLGQLVKIANDANEIKRITIDQMIDELKAIYGAGHLTTMSVLSWTVFLLAINQDWQDKVRDEMNMVINKSLRLYPPVITMTRKVDRKIKLGNFTLPANVIRLGQNYIDCLYELNIKSLPGGCLGYLIISVVKSSGWIPVSDQVILMCREEEKDIEFTLEFSSDTIKGKLTESITKIENGTKLEKILWNREKLLSNFQAYLPLLRVVLCKCFSTGRPLGAYNLGVVTPRALVYAGLMTSRDVRSWCVLIKVNGWFWRLKMCTLRNLGFKTEVMSTPAYVDSETITQADGAQNSREAPLEAEESQLLGSRVPLMGEEFEASKPSGTRTISSHYSASSDSTTPLSPDHPLIQASPTPTPTRVLFHPALSPSSFRKRYRSSYETPSPSSSLSLPIHKRYRGTSKLILDTETEDESSDSDAEGEGSEDEGPGSDKEEDEAAAEGHQQAVPVVDTPMDNPLGLGYGALRCHELALGEGSMPSMFELDPEDDRVYTDIPTYVPPVALVQTPPSPEWSPGSLSVSPSSLVVPLPIASPVTTPAATISIDEDQFLEVGAQLELHEGILHDHTQRLDALPPTLFKGYDRDLRELYTRSGAVRDEIFSQRYRFRSLEREQERAIMTFSAIWRSVLALEAWAGQTDAQRAALWHPIYDIQRENHDLRRQIAEEMRERLELTDRVARMERRQESGRE